MLIAREKRKTNIIEYILYLYQIEDIIRSFQFDINAIDNAIVQQYDQPETVKSEIRKWYLKLIAAMESQNIKSKGHLQELKDIILELHNLHQQLLTTIQDKKYIKLYDEAKTPLKELVLKSKGQQLSNEIDVALHGLYGLLVLRLKKQTIGKETEVAMRKVSAFLAYLAMQFKKQEEEGQLSFPDDRNN